MASKINSRKVDLLEIIDHLTEMIFSPMILPIATAVKQPIVQVTIKESIVVSESLKKALVSPDANVIKTFDHLMGIIFSPMILPIAAAVKQPIVQITIKESVALSEKYTKAFRDLMEALARINANTNTHVIRETTEKFESKTTQIYVMDGKSEAAKDLINLLSDFNADVGRITNGIADLRLLIPLGIGLLAIRQLLTQGVQLEEIPWHLIAWYAFDIFVKFNNVEESLQEHEYS